MRTLREKVALKQKAMNRLVLYGFLVALGLALLLSPFASPWPDGLERVAEDKGFLGRGEIEHFRAPIPDYVLPGLRNERVATAFAGGLGTVAMLGAGYGLNVIFRRRKGKRAA